MGKLPELWELVLIFVGLPLVAVTVLVWLVVKFRNETRPK
jgi:hypothetical protein